MFTLGLATLTHVFRYSLYCYFYQRERLHFYIWLGMLGFIAGIAFHLFILGSFTLFLKDYISYLLTVSFVQWHAVIGFLTTGV